jgi:hypothetical protein
VPIPPVWQHDASSRPHAERADENPALGVSCRAGKAELVRRSILPDDGQVVTRADRLEEPGRSNLTADCPCTGREHTHDLP